MGTRNHSETGIFPQVNLIFQFASTAWQVDSAEAETVAQIKHLAQRAAKEHARKNHQGNMRWTEINQFR